MDQFAARKIRIDGNLAFVPLTKGYEAIIDAADAAIVSGFYWHAYIERKADGSIKAVYARRNEAKDGGGQRTVLMHRQILCAKPGCVVDHADSDGLNNQRANLRSATFSQNARNARTRTDNTSGFKGVTWHNQRNKWKAQIWRDGKQRSLGLFDHPEQAAAAYAAASAAFHGEFGRVA